MANDTQKSIHWIEFDVLRGLAALMMILNHLGYKILAPNWVDSSFGGSLLFISSFASLGNEPQTWGILNWILGTKDALGVSYPFSPWMAYPFVGYIIGVAAMRYTGFDETRRWRAVSGLLMLGGLNSIAGLIRLQRGASFFRWGTVGIGFYVVSFAVISISLAGVLAICGEPKLRVGQDALSLKGIASLAVVPIHYFLIYLVGIAGGTGVDLLKYSLIAIAVLTASFFLARSVENFSQIIRQVKKQRVVWFGLAAMFVLAAGLTLFYSQESKYLALFPRTFGQIVLCLLFVVRLPL